MQKELSYRLQTANLNNNGICCEDNSTHDEVCFQSITESTVNFIE